MTKKGFVSLAVILMGTAFLAIVGAPPAEAGTAWAATVVNASGSPINVTFTYFSTKFNKVGTLTKPIAAGANYKFGCRDQENPVKLEGTITTGGVSKTIKTTCIAPADTTCSATGYPVNTSWDVKRVTGAADAPVNDNDHEFVKYPQ